MINIEIESNNIIVTQKRYLSEEMIEILSIIANQGYYEQRGSDVNNIKYDLALQSLLRLNIVKSVDDAWHYTVELNEHIKKKTISDLLIKFKSNTKKYFIKYGNVSIEESGFFSDDNVNILTLDSSYCDKVGMDYVEKNYETGEVSKAVFEKILNNTKKYNKKLKEEFNE